MTVLKMTDLDLAGKRVLIREDLNVPVKDGVVKTLNVEAPGAFEVSSADAILKAL